MFRKILPIGAAALLVGACGSDNGLGLVPDSFTELTISPCDPSGTTLSTNIDNPYFPMPVGRKWVLEGIDDGAQERVEIEVTNQTREVNGVSTRVLTETEYVNGALAEISYNYYAQNSAGDVCYFGEQVDNYSNGTVINNNGTWLAEGNNQPGILVPGNPTPNTQFYQEYAPGEALDKSAVYQLGQSVSAPAGSYNNVMVMVDWDELVGDSLNDGDLKYYASGVGPVRDEELFLVEYVAGSGEPAELDLAVCDPAQITFSLTIDNPYFPLPVGRQLVLQGVEDGATIRMELDVLTDTEVVGGITTRVVTETEYEDNVIKELTRNYFAQSASGDVCYFGEAVENYENGVLTNTNGTWRAENGNQPGIQMPASPQVMTQFYQEVAPGVAEDKSAIGELGLSRTVPAGSYDNVLQALDWNELEGQTLADAEEKYYAPGIGLIQDGVLELISMQN